MTRKLLLDLSNSQLAFTPILISLPDHRAVTSEGSGNGAQEHNSRPGWHRVSARWKISWGRRWLVRPRNENRFEALTSHDATGY